MLKFLKVFAITLYCLTATVYADDTKIKEIFFIFFAIIIRIIINVKNTNWTKGQNDNIID